MVKATIKSSEPSPSISMKFSKQQFSAPSTTKSPVKVPRSQASYDGPLFLEVKLT